jgi:Ulp1 family protease
MVKYWIRHRVNGKNKCSFKVLDIKNQDNNYDCGLMLCLLIWQFFQNRDVKDLERFPSKKEFSHNYRLAVALALSMQQLEPIEHIV